MAKKIKRVKRVSKKDRVLRFLEEMEWMFGINTHDRVVAFREKDCENDDGADIAAEIHYNQEYQNVKITIYPCFLEHTLEEQRKMLLHELCHVITLPSKTASHSLHAGNMVTTDEIRRINEEATSKIENMLHQLLKGNLKYAKTGYNNYLK